MEILMCLLELVIEYVLFYIRFSCENGRLKISSLEKSYD